MPMLCTYCAHNNPDKSIFCQACGKPLQRESELADSLSQPNTSQNDPFLFSEPTSLPNESTLSFIPQAPQAPITSAREQSTNNQFNEETVAFVPQTPQAPQAPQAPIIPIRVQQQSSPPIVQMGTISRDLHLSRIHAFAGHGVIVTHQSWFLSEKATAASDMLKTSFDILHRRSVLALHIDPKNLHDHGTQTEIRHYLVLRRGVATVFLYIAPAGHDLYISRVTTVLTSIDAFRRFILIALIVIGVLLFLIFPISIPIWLGLILFFAFSFRNWLRERDFWIYLRKRDLNDFQLDDVSVIEHLTDDTLKVAATQNNIDADKLVPPTKGYQHERRIRAV